MLKKIGHGQKIIMIISHVLGKWHSLWSQNLINITLYKKF